MHDENMEDQQLTSKSSATSVATTPSSHPSDSRSRSIDDDSLNENKNRSDDSLNILDQYDDYKDHKLLDENDGLGAIPPHPGHIKIPTHISILTEQSSIDTPLATSPIIRVESLAPQTAKHLGIINALIEFFEKATTPLLLLLLLSSWGMQHLNTIWMGVPAAALVTFPIAIAAFLMFNAKMQGCCKGYVYRFAKIFAIIGLSLALSIAAYSLSLHYLNTYDIPWHLLLSGIFSFALFSFSIAYTQYILISHKACIKSDLETKESNFQLTYYNSLDQLPRKQKIKSILMFWSAFVEALSISFLTYTFFTKIGWLTIDPLISTILWILISGIALSRFIKVVNSDAAEAEKIDNERTYRLNALSNNENISRNTNDIYATYKVNKYTTSKYFDKFFARIIQLFSYGITPMIEDATNWIALFVLYYDIKQMHEFRNLTQCEIKIIFYVYLASTLLALFGEYFFQFAADRKWTRINTTHKYASPRNSLTWRARPSFYGRILLSIPLIPALFYVWGTKIFRCPYHEKTARKVLYATAMISKSFGNSAILGVSLIEFYYLAFGNYPNLTLTLILLSIALGVGVLKGYGQSRARKLEANNLSEIILNQLMLVPDESNSTQQHGYQDSNMTQVAAIISRNQKIYAGLNLTHDDRLVLKKSEIFFLLLWVASTFIVGLNYFEWIHLFHEVYVGSIILSAILLIGLCLYQIRDICQCSTTESSSERLSYDYSSLGDKKTERTTPIPNYYGPDTFQSTLSTRKKISSPGYSITHVLEQSHESPFPYTTISTNENGVEQSPS